MNISNQNNTTTALTTNYTSMTNEISALISGNNAILEHVIITAVAGTDIVPADFITSTAGFNTKIMDLVLVDLRLSSNPSKRNLSHGVFGIYAGNRNIGGQVKYSILATKNDFLLKISALDNYPAKIVNQPQQ